MQIIAKQIDFRRRRFTLRSALAGRAIGNSNTKMEMNEPQPGSAATTTERARNGVNIFEEDAKEAKAKLQLKRKTNA